MIIAMAHSFSIVQNFDGHPSSLASIDKEVAYHQPLYRQLQKTGKRFQFTPVPKDSKSLART